MWIFFYLIQLDRWAYPSIRLHFLLRSTGQNVINLTHSNHLMALHLNCARGQGHVFFKKTSQSFIWTAFSSTCGFCIIRTISSCSHDDSMYWCLQSHALHGSISIVLWSPLILREWLVFPQFTSNQKHERLHAPHCLWRSYFPLFGIIWKQMHKVHLAGAYMCDVRIFSPCLCGIFWVLHPTVQTHAVSGVSLTGDS